MEVAGQGESSQPRRGVPSRNPKSIKTITNPQHHITLFAAAKAATPNPSTVASLNRSSSPIAAFPAQSQPQSTKQPPHHAALSVIPQQHRHLHWKKSPRLASSSTSSTHPSRRLLRPSPQIPDAGAAFLADSQHRRRQGERKPPCLHLPEAPPSFLRSKPPPLLPEKEAPLLPLFLRDAAGLDGDAEAAGLGSGGGVAARR
ncbi:hypothetical protein Droror1_Dr00018608 [Drosera rotundifolia]